MRRFIATAGLDFHCLCLFLSLSSRVMVADGDESERNSQWICSHTTPPEGLQIYGERAIKSLYKDTGAEFSEYSVYKACMVQVNDAGGIRWSKEEAEERGHRVQSHYWPWICLSSPIAVLPLASGARQSIRKTKAFTSQVLLVCMHMRACPYFSFSGQFGWFRLDQTCLPGVAVVKTWRSALWQLVSQQL